MKLKGKFFIGLIFMVLAISCQKSEDRTCWKGGGSYAERIVPLDTARAFHGNKNIKYRIYQDVNPRIIIKGGKNLIQHIEIDNRDNVIYIDNRNKCNFLRNSDAMVEVEIHYPHLQNFFFDATDSIVFANKVTTNSLNVEMRDGGGSLYADVDVHKISMVVSHGAGDFTLKGKADEAELKIQNNGAANAINFRSTYTYIYQNSTSDIFINLDKSSALIVIDGTGDVFYKHNAGNIESEGVGQGQIIKL